MKQLFLIASAFIIFGSCNQPTATGTKDPRKSDNATMSATAQNISMPYTPMYATDFEIGDYTYAQTVFNLWKHYDDNDFSTGDAAFADTVSMDFPDGSTIKGKDPLNNAIKKFRGSVISAKEAVLTYVVLHPKSSQDTWVSIWGNEVDAYKDGKTDTTWMNENWKFNKDGKVAYISQYAAGKNLITKK